MGMGGSSGVVDIIREPNVNIPVKPKVARSNPSKGKKTLNLLGRIRRSVIPRVHHNCTKMGMGWSPGFVST